MIKSCGIDGNNRVSRILSSVAYAVTKARVNGMKFLYRSIYKFPNFRIGTTSLYPMPSSIIVEMIFKLIPSIGVFPFNFCKNI